MKIAFLSQYYWPPKFGGELLLSIERFKSLVQRGNQVIVLTEGEEGYPQNELMDNIHVFRSPRVMWNNCIGKYVNDFVFYGWLFWKMSCLRCDAIHIGYFSVHIRPIVRYSLMRLLVSIAHWRSIPSFFVYSLADTPEDPLVLGGISGGIKKQFLRGVDYLVAVSPSIIGAMKRKLSSTNSILIPNAVRDNLFVPADAKTRRIIRKKLGFSSGDIIFVFLGSVCYRKGFDLLAKAFSELNQTHQSWKLLVIGPNSSTESKFVSDLDVKEFTSVLKQNTNVVFLGRVNDREEVAQYLAASDVFVFPTRNEGMPLSPMEAMATGVPVIISYLPGITDQVNIDGETGFYIPTDDIESLKNAMFRLGNDKLLRKRMGRKARDTILDRYSWSRHVTQWEEIYTSYKIRKLFG